MKVLILGAGGREHALAWKIGASPLLTQVYAAPRNPGIAACAEIVDLSPADHAAVTGFCKDKSIDLVVIGPEGPLVDGLADSLAAAGIRAFGPSRGAARLEGSKAFTKEICDEGGIPTARWRRFTDAAKARAYVEAEGMPIVVKADGLAAGKGVTVATTKAEATAAVDACFGGKFGSAGAELVIEECLVGTEASFFALCDGETAIPFGTARDHKRVGDGDTGPDTGGMGAYSPAGLIDDALSERIMAEIIRPTLTVMRRRGTPFRGVLYAGLMLTAAGPKLIEYNVRFGDPECQVLMMRLESDLLELMLAAVEGRLSQAKPRWRPDPALTVVMAARGYPEKPESGTVIRGVEAADALPGAKVFHAGTALKDGALVAAGGRVLNVSASAPTVAEARRLAYAAVDRIDWPGGFCRRDIAGTA